MRKIYMAMFVLVTASGCGKDPFKPNTLPQADFTIQRLRTFTNGQTNSQVETALNLDASSNFMADFQVKGANLVFEIGGKKITTVEPKLFANIVFYNQTDPLKIEGSYILPRDADKVNISLCDIVPQGYYCVDEPLEASIQIEYDPILKKWNGNISRLKYPIPPGADYTYEECSIRFSDVLFND